MPDLENVDDLAERVEETAAEEHAPLVGEQAPSEDILKRPGSETAQSESHLEFLNAPELRRVETVETPAVSPLSPGLVLGLVLNGTFTVPSSTAPFTIASGAASQAAVLAPVPDTSSGGHVPVTTTTPLPVLVPGQPASPVDPGGQIGPTLSETGYFSLLRLSYRVQQLEARVAALEEKLRHHGITGPR